jgi:hypothetical protein
MDDELITRLRAWAKQIVKNPDYVPENGAELLIRAAHEIERLRAESTTHWVPTEVVFRKCPWGL